MPSDRTGLPFLDIYGGFDIGNGWEGELPQVGNSFQFSDSLSWVKGSHTMKFGADIRRSRFDQTYYYNVSGNQLPPEFACCSARSSYSSRSCG